MEDKNDTPDLLVADSPREKLIATAVKFLLNPKVRPTTLAHKKKFLAKKGLTEEEIDLACQQAGCYNEENMALGMVPTPYYKPSFWIKAKDVANMVALISIGSYSLYSFWKNYVAPRLFGTRSRLEEKYEKLINSIGKLNESVMELKDLMKTLQSSRPSNEFAEIRNELKAIKGLLLNRNQFPLTASCSSGIPSWQMLDLSGDGDKSDDSTSRRRKSKSEKTRQEELLREDESNIILGEDAISRPGPIRKHPSIDSNNGFNSGSSCEVVSMGKNDSSDPDHSD